MQTDDTTQKCDGFALEAAETQVKGAVYTTTYNNVDDFDTETLMTTEF